MLRQFVTFIVNLFGRRKAPAKNYAPDRPQENPLQLGKDGPIESDIVVLRDMDRFVMSIDYNFKDVLGWVEWDISENKLLLVQKSGAVATLGSVIPAEEIEEFRTLNKVFVITRYNNQKIMHNLGLIVRD